MKNKKFLLFVLILLLVTVFSLLHSRYGLVVTRYEVPTEGLKQPIRMVHLIPMKAF